MLYYKQSNQDIRELLKKEHIYIWQVAKKLGVHEVTLGKYLRTELSEERKKKVLAAIEEIKTERAEEQ